MGAWSRARLIKSPIWHSTCGTYGIVVRILVPLTASDTVIDEGLNMLADALNQLQGKNA